MLGLFARLGQVWLGYLGQASLAWTRLVCLEATVRAARASACLQRASGLTSSSPFELSGHQQGLGLPIRAPLGAPGLPLGPPGYPP